MARKNDTAKKAMRGGPPRGGYRYPGYYPRHRYYRPRPGGSFFLGLLAGGIGALATAAIVDMALDDARDQYKEETGETMPKCSDIPEEKYARDKKGEWLCSDTKDGGQICFYKNRKSDENNKACYIP
jgi:hypothetical protein